jgi:hypothetical protein
MVELLLPLVEAAVEAAMIILLVLVVEPIPMGLLARPRM